MLRRQPAGSAHRGRDTGAPLSESEHPPLRLVPFRPQQAWRTASSRPRRPPAPQVGSCTLPLAGSRLRPEAGADWAACWGRPAGTGCAAQGACPPRPAGRRAPMSRVLPAPPAAPPAGQTLCNPTNIYARYCADLSADEANCGSCGAKCPAGSDCVNGACSCWNRMCSGARELQLARRRRRLGAAARCCRAGGS